MSLGRLPRAPHVRHSRSRDLPGSSGLRVRADDISHYYMRIIILVAVRVVAGRHEQNKVKIVGSPQVPITGVDGAVLNYYFKVEANG